MPWTLVQRAGCISHFMGPVNGLSPDLIAANIDIKGSSSSLMKCLFKINIKVGILSSINLLTLKKQVVIRQRQNKKMQNDVVSVVNDKLLHVSNLTLLGFNRLFPK